MIRPLLSACALLAAMAIAPGASASGVLVFVDDSGSSAAFGTANTCNGGACSFADELVSSTQAPRASFVAGVSADDPAFKIADGHGEQSLFEHATEHRSVDRAIAKVTANKIVPHGATSGQTGSSSLPEPGTWALMLLGFGAVGYSMRKRPVQRLKQAV